MPTQCLDLAGRPGYPACISWSEDNILAVAAGPTVTIVAAGDLDGPKEHVTFSDVDLSSGHVDGYHPGPGNVTFALRAATARNPARSMHMNTMVRGVTWSPLGVLPSGSAALAVVTDDHKVRVYGPPDGAVAEWQLLFDVSAALSQRLQACNWEMEMRIAADNKAAAAAVAEAMPSTSAQAKATHSLRAPARQQPLGMIENGLSIPQLDGQNDSDHCSSLDIDMEATGPATGPELGSSPKRRRTVGHCDRTPAGSVPTAGDHPTTMQLQQLASAQMYGPTSAGDPALVDVQPHPEQEQFGQQEGPDAQWHGATEQNAELKGGAGAGEQSREEHQGRRHMHFTEGAHSHEPQPAAEPASGAGGLERRDVGPKQSGGRQQEGDVGAERQAARSENSAELLHHFASQQADATSGGQQQFPAGTARSPRAASPCEQQPKPPQNAVTVKAEALVAAALASAAQGGQPVKAMLEGVLPDSSVVPAGMVVEVTTQEEGLQLAWHRGVVQEHRHNFALVQHSDLFQDEAGTQPLLEWYPLRGACRADSQRLRAEVTEPVFPLKGHFVRPQPPTTLVLPAASYAAGMRVDVRDDDAWWAAVVSEDWEESNNMQAENKGVRDCVLSSNGFYRLNMWM